MKKLKILYISILFGFFVLTMFNARVEAATNIITNNSVEISSNGTTPDNWVQGKYGVNDISFTYPVAGQLGSKAVKVSATSVSSGDGKWFFTDIPVSAGEKYTYSEYYQSNINTEIVVRFSKNGVYSYQSLLSPLAANVWTVATSTITIPTGVTSMTVFHILAKPGYLVTDNFSLTKIQTTAFSSGMVSLTFDDGWYITYKNAIPILNNAGYKSTQYIIADYLQNAPGYVTTQQALSMKNQGHEIGSHSLSHPDLTTLSISSLTNEIQNSKSKLVSLGLGPINSFAFPYGAYNDSVLNAVKQAGYLNARTAQYVAEDMGYNEKTTDKFKLKAYSVETTTSVAQVKSWIDSATNNKTWVVLVFHQIDNSKSQYSFTPSNLTKVVNYLKQKNTRVVTITEGSSFIQ